MRVTPTNIPDVLIIEPIVHNDHRGLFLEVYHVEQYTRYGILGPFVQDNLSHSTTGVVRGLHLQNPRAQGKLVTVLSGAVLDVAVDVRTGSPTFGKHVAIELNEHNRKQVWVPRGFAHGFAVLSDQADFFYKCDALYSHPDEITIRWDDPAIGIDWRVTTPIVSSRDAEAPLLAQIDVARLPSYGNKR